MWLEKINNEYNLNLKIEERSNNVKILTTNFNNIKYCFARVRHQPLLEQHFNNIQNLELNLIDTMGYIMIDFKSFLNKIKPFGA